jgi:hypothetical protein
MRTHADPLELLWRRPVRPRTPRLRSASRLAALLARARAPWLDRELSEGVESWRTRVHAARALQVTSDRHRHQLADWLERLLGAADAAPPPVSPLSAKITPCAEQILLAREEMLTLSACLRAHVPIDAGTTIRLRLLLADGGGPCYRQTRPFALRDALAGLAAALELRD